MKIFIGTDHAGFSIKQEVINILKNLNCETIDIGCFDDSSVDYPDFAHEVAKQVLANKDSFGVLICGTGIGISIAANKHKGIRAALCHDSFTASMARAHNNANILAFGQRVVGLGVIEDMLNAFLNTPYEGGRHEHRISKIEAKTDVK